MILSGVEKKIIKQLEKLNLRPAVSPAQFLRKYPQKHRYFSRCFNETKQPVIFYCRLHDNLDAREKMIREIYFLKELKKTGYGLKQVTPRLLNYGLENNFEWLLKDYVAGKSMGDLTRSPLLRSPKLIKDLVENITLIARVKIKFPSESKINYFDCQKYIRKEGLANILKEKEMSRFEKMVSQAYPLLVKENNFLCHGDLNLGNVILDKHKKVWLIDWELVQLNNKFYDIAYFWSHCWREKAFRQRLLGAYLDKLPSGELAKFKKIFPLPVFYLALGGIKLKRKRENKQRAETRKNFYKQALKNSLKGFEKLIKT